MKNRYMILALCSALMSMTIKAQVVEDFEYNHLDWNECSFSKREAIIKDGVLHIKNKDKQDWAMCTCEMPLDVTIPFTIKVTCKDTKINDDHSGIGLVWNYKDDFNLEYFYFSQEEVIYAQTEGGDITRHLASDLKIDKKSKDHVIELKYKNGTVTLTIDDVQALEVKYEQINHNNFGLLAWGKGQSADFDQVEFFQY